MKAATKLASLPFGELDRLVKAIGECKSKSEEDRIISAEVDVLKQRLSDPRLDKTRGREYMVRIMYCEMLGHDVSFAYIPVLQMASDPNLLNKKAAYLCLTQLLDYKHELVLLLVNTLLSDLKNDNFVVIATALVVTSKLIGADLINAVLPHVIERVTHPRESVRKKAVMALLHFHQMDPDRTGPLAGVDLERHFRTSLCDKEPSVMAATLNALIALAADNPAPFSRALIPSLTSILKQVVEHRLPKAYDYHRFPAPFIQIKLLKLLGLLAAGDKAASDNCAAVVSSALRRAASGGNHTIGNAIVYEAVRAITAMYPNPSLLASAAEAVAVLIKSPAHNLKYCGLTALAAITRVSPKYAQEHQMAVIDCLEDPDETLKLKTLELLVTMTKANNVQVVVERLMAFLRSTSCGGDEVMRRHIAGQIVELAEKYAPDTAWYIRVMAEVFEVAGDVLQPQLAHNLCRLVAEQDGELHSAAVQLFLGVLDKGTAAGAVGSADAAGGSKGSKVVLPDLLLCCICWVLGEYGTLAEKLQPPHKVTVGQVMDKLCSAVAITKASSTVRAYLLTALTKLAALQQQQSGGGADSVLRPDAKEALHKARSSRNAELQQRAQEAESLLSLPPALLSAVLPFDGSCEEFETAEIEEAKGLTFLEGYVQQALSAGATPYNPPPDLASIYTEEDLEALGLPGLGASSSQAAAGAAAGQHKLRFDAYEKAQAPTSATAASAAGGAFGSSSPAQQQQPASAAAAMGLIGQQQQQQWQQPAASAAAAGPAQPQLMLKGAGKGRWGPAEFSSNSNAAPAAAAPAAIVPPAAAAASSSSSSSYRAQQQQQQKAMSERDRLLAASLFGGGGDDSTASTGVRGGARAKPPAAAAAAPPPVADLLGGDVLDSPAPVSPAKAAGGLDLLMELDAPAPAAAAPSSAAAAAAGGDLLGGLGVPAPAATAAASGGQAGVGMGGLLDLHSMLGSPTPLGHTAAAGVGGGGADLLDLGLITLTSPQQQQQQVPQMPLPALTAAGAGGGAKGGPMGGSVAMRGGQPAKGSQLVSDPFKDLLG